MAKQNATTLRIAKAIKNWGGTTPGMNNIPIVNRNNGTRIATIRNDINHSERLTDDPQDKCPRGENVDNSSQSNPPRRFHEQRAIHGVLNLYLDSNTDVENTKTEMLARLLRSFYITRDSHCVAANPIATSTRRSVAYRTYASMRRFLLINRRNRGVRTPVIVLH